METAQRGQCWSRHVMTSPQKQKKRQKEKEMELQRDRSGKTHTI